MLRVGIFSYFLHSSRIIHLFLHLQINEMGKRCLYKLQRDPSCVQFGYTMWGYSDLARSLEDGKCKKLAPNEDIETVNELYSKQQEEADGISDHDAHKSSYGLRKTICHCMRISLSLLFIRHTLNRLSTSFLSKLKP